MQAVLPPQAIIKHGTVVWSSTIVACLAACAGFVFHIMLLSTPTQRLKDGLLVDFDPALGVPFRDVDDAIALHYLHK